MIHALNAGREEMRSRQPAGSTTTIDAFARHPSIGASADTHRGFARHPSIGGISDRVVRPAMPVFGSSHSSTNSQSLVQT